RVASNDSALNEAGCPELNSADRSFCAGSLEHIPLELKALDGAAIGDEHDVRRIGLLKIISDNADRTSAIEIQLVGRVAFDVVASNRPRLTVVFEVDAFSAVALDCVAVDDNLMERVDTICEDAIALIFNNVTVVDIDTYSH